ncbi:hypothetical protein CSUI_003159 [Cystoisospora suis]|uniref:C2HC/C3H-type domain-containing protein n=1 Tax=Cystoisospora suis TaxID=483139 RepID=A0A2C6KRD1_9APIC|nr:hypothetical protein CSUI_003159 [Cystoisospora suis]
MFLVNLLDLRWDAIVRFCFFLVFFFTTTHSKSPEANMHQRAVVCTMCGGKFFPASLAFHQKACAAKQASVMLPCPYCDEEVPKPQLDQHIKTSCKKSPKPRKKSAMSSGPLSGEDTCTGINDVIDDQGRMQCAVCGRWFLQDRIGKHQSICRAVKDRNDAKPHTVFDSFKQRQFDPLIRPAMDNKRVGRTTPIPSARSYYCAASSSPQAPQVSGGRGTPARNGRSVSRSPRDSETQRPPSSRQSAVANAPRSPGAQPRASVSPRPSAVPPSSRNAQSSSLSSRRGTPTQAESLMPAPARPQRLSPSSRGEGLARAVGATNKVGTGSRRSSGASDMPAETAKRQSLRVPGRGGATTAVRAVGNARDKPSSPSQARSRPSPAFLSPGRTSSPVAGEGGRILPTNESSLDNPLAYPYPNYPGGDPSMSPQHAQTVRSLSPPSPVQYVSPTSTRDRRDQGVTYRPSGGGGILPTNETSADNPLAYPYRR